MRLRGLSRSDVSIGFMDESKASQFCFVFFFFLFVSSFLSGMLKVLAGMGLGLDLDLDLDLDLG